MADTYTSGELASRAGVSVRTVQYYDRRGILKPSAHSEGGRRLYNEADLDRLLLICFLRELGFSIENIKRLLAEESADQTLQVLLAQHIVQEKAEVAAHKRRLNQLTQLEKSLKGQESVDFPTLSDLSLTMKNNRAWKKFVARFLLKIALLVLVFYALVALGEQMDWIWLNILATVLFFAACFWLLTDYFRRVVYLCPHCHQTFEPAMWSAMWAFHTPKTRRLTCPHCGEKSFCLELVKED